MDNMRICLALSLFLFAGAAAGDPIFKWVDEQGVTHYSAGNPKNQKAQQVKVQPASRAMENATQQSSLRTWEATESMKKNKQRREQQEEADNELKEEKANRCDSARQRLGVLQDQIPVYSRNKKGEREYWDDNTREDEIRKTKEEISSNC